MYRIRGFLHDKATIANNFFLVNVGESIGHRVRED